MIETTDDKTIIRPSPKKWFTGAAIFLVLGLLMPSVAWFFLTMAVGFAAMASGKLTRLELSAQGLKSIKLGQTRCYRWEDVEDFKIVSIRTSLFSSTKMLAFSRKDKKDTFTGKASRFLGGGTESVSFSGATPAQISATIAGYQARHMMFGSEARQGSDFEAHSPAKPPQPQKPKGAIGFGRPETVNPHQTASSPTQAPAKPVFGRQSPSTPIRATKPKSDPLVEEGGWMRKRRDGTGF